MDLTHAYIHTYIATDQRKLYRVRVGKISKEEAINVSKKLQNLDFIDQVQVVKL